MSAGSSWIRTTLAWAAGSWWVRLGVSVGLLAAVLTQIDLSSAVNRLSEGHWGLFAAGWAVYLAAFVIAAARWHLFLEAAGLHRGPWRTTEAYFAGVFATNFLPSSFGGDAVRAWLGGGPGERVKAFSTVLVDRGSILGCAFLVGWVAVLVDTGSVPTSVVLTLAAAFVLYLVGVGGVTAAAFAAARFRHRIPRRLMAFGHDVLPAARAALSSRTVLTWTTVVGVVYELLAITAFWLVARSVDVHLSFLALAVVMPSVLVLSALPISIGGLGVREGSFVALLHPLGVPATDAALVSLLAATAFALATLPGAILVFVRRSAIGLPRPGLQPPNSSR
jgi:uncharacterized protein (TIRG00374 family)